MKISSSYHAREHASKYLHHNTLIVEENGNIHASCNIDQVCKTLEEEKKEFFIINGERKKVKSKSDDLQTK